eukprot:965793-Alexandrium_andersonii.AAC.1
MEHLLGLAQRPRPEPAIQGLVPRPPPRSRRGGDRGPPLRTPPHTSWPPRAEEWWGGADARGLR